MASGEVYEPAQFDESKAEGSAVAALNEYDEKSNVGYDDSMRNARADTSSNDKYGTGLHVTLSESDEEKVQAFLKDISSTEREQEVDRILSCFKLNPYEHLNLNLDASDDDVRRAYRKSSLMVHPDKCNHPQAQRAFEALGLAQSMILEDSHKRAELQSVFERAKEAVKQEWAKEAKRDTAARTRYGHDPEAMWKQFERSPEFHLRWKAKAREVLTENEWRKRRMHGRMQRDEEQAKLEYQTEKEEVKESKKRKQEWEETREERVGGWRKFMQAQQRKKQKKRGTSATIGAAGGAATRELRPPGPKPEQKRHERNNQVGLLDGRRIERPDEVSKAF